MSLIDNKIIFIEKAEEAFGSSLEKVDRRYLREIIKIYASYVEKGILQFDALKLAELEDILVRALTLTDYATVAKSYLSNFEGLQALNKKLHKKLNKIEVGKAIAENERIVNHVEKVTTELKGTPTGLMTVIERVKGKDVKKLVPYRNASLDRLIGPIADLMREDIISGVSFDSATERISEAITSQNLGLERWAKQIAKDALHQNDGLIQNEIRKEFKLKYVTYVGTIKDTTRPFCYHMITENQTVKFTDYEKILNEYIPEGVPSTTKVTYAPLGNKRSRAKGSGMIPGTDLSNIFIRRGGYACRHAMVPTSVK